MAAARALALAAARRRVAAAAQAPPAPTAALLAPRATPLLEGSLAPPPLGGRLAPPAALLHGRRAPPPPPHAAALHAPRELPPPLGARLLRVLPATAPPAATLGPHRLLSTGAFVQPGHDGEAKRAAADDETTRAGAVEAGYAKGGAAGGGNKTSCLVVDKSGIRGANSTVLTRDTKLAGGIRGADEVPAAAKAVSDDVVQKAGALDLGARPALPAPLLGPRSPHLLGARLRPLQPTTPLAAALGGLLRFSTIQRDGDAAAPNGSKRGASTAGKGDRKRAADTSSDHAKIREMLKKHTKAERMRDTTHTIVWCLVFLFEVVVLVTIGVIYAVEVFHREMAIISDDKKTTGVEEQQKLE